jgi:hypothetical protein
MVDASTAELDDVQELITGAGLAFGYSQNGKKRARLSDAAVAAVRLENKLRTRAVKEDGQAVRNYSTLGLDSAKFPSDTSVRGESWITRSW